MDADLTAISVTGSLLVLAALAALGVLVKRDLAPAGPPPGPALGSGGGLFLGAAMGTGVIAFAIKLAVIWALAAFPHHTVDRLLPGPGAVRPRPAAPALIPPPTPRPEPRPFWRPLPAVAPAPAGNPTTPARAALGERLFRDPALSADGTVSCASCHDLDRAAGADGRPVARGVGGQLGDRNTPTVYNAAFQTRLFWDGRAPSLETQALGPLVNPREMAMPSLAAVADRVRADPAYAPAFRRAFGSDRVTIGRIVKALAAFERTLVTADSPYDRFVAGRAEALSPAQKRGMWLFRTLGCATCHAGPAFGGAPSAFRALLVDRAPAARAHGLDADKGRAGPGARNGVWRVPSLRNVALTAPYFHNGSVTDLAGAVRVMAAAQLNARVGDPPAGARFAPRWSAAEGRFERTGRKRVTEADLADIVAFLRALSSDRLARRAGS